MAEMTNDGFQVLTLGAAKADGTPDMANILFSFPCPHNAMTISQAVKIDEVSVPGRSGKVKQATGYDDTNITVTIRLDDREERAAPGEDGPYVITRSAAKQLSELQAAFRDRSTVAPTTSKTIAPPQVPTVFSILSRLTSLCGIKTVLFKTMDVTEFEGETYIQVSMSFTEFEPAPRVAERSGRKKKKVAEYDSFSQYIAGYDGFTEDNAFVGPVAEEYAWTEADKLARKRHAIATLGDAAVAKLKEYEAVPEDPLVTAKMKLEKVYAQFSYNYDQKVAADEAKARSVVGNAQDTRRSHGYN